MRLVDRDQRQLRALGQLAEAGVLARSGAT
jgi:hypothetical protein